MLTKEILTSKNLNELKKIALDLRIEKSATSKAGYISLILEQQSKNTSQKPTKVTDKTTKVLQKTDADGIISFEIPAKKYGVSIDGELIGLRDYRNNVTTLANLLTILRPIMEYQADNKDKSVYVHFDNGLKVNIATLRKDVTSGAKSSVTGAYNGINDDAEKKIAVKITNLILLNRAFDTEKELTTISDIKLQFTEDNVFNYENINPMVQYFISSKIEAKDITFNMLFDFLSSTGETRLIGR